MIVEKPAFSVAVDPEGYLYNPEDWNEDVCSELAADEGIALSEEHWKVIRFMRAWYDDKQVAADARHVIKYLDEELGYGKEGRSRLFELFPYGYVKQACRIAGMRRPRGWSTG